LHRIPTASVVTDALLLQFVLVRVVDGTIAGAASAASRSGTGHYFLLHVFGKFFDVKAPASSSVAMMAPLLDPDASVTLHDKLHARISDQPHNQPVNRRSGRSCN
jgi:hypothetical protein